MMPEVGSDATQTRPEQGLIAFLMSAVRSTSLPILTAAPAEVVPDGHGTDRLGSVAQIV